MKTETYTIVNFPAWALCCLINGDMEGLTDKEIDQVARFEKRFNQPCYSYKEESHFSWLPEFGLACDCVELTVVEVAR